MAKILLFIPAYNCQRQIPRVFEKLTPDIVKHLAEVIVVDNRSTDDSRAAAEACLGRLQGIKASLLQNDANYSLGGSVKVALNYALENGHDYLLVLHGDDQADIRDMAPLLNAPLPDADLCIGARFHPDSLLKGYSLIRIAGNKGFNLLLSFITRRRIDDLIAGLNLYRLSAFKGKWYLGFPDNLTFDAHLLLYGLHHGFRITYFPISWREEDQVSNAKIFKQGWILLKLFLRYALGKKVFAEKPAKVYTSKTVYSRAA